MKKWMYFVIFVGLFLITDRVDAQSYYRPYYYSYYQRGQHTYSFTGKDQVPHNEYAPALYTIITDEDLIHTTESWDFFEHYQVPWTVDEKDYFVGYCADLDINAERQVYYNRLSLEESTYINNDIKNNLRGIILNSYPFISKDDMLKMLVEKGVLVEKQLENETVITAKTNLNPTRSIKSDELVSAVTMAIYQYTNPGEVEDVYYNTYPLSPYEKMIILKDANQWENLYTEKAKYDEVNNNIEAIYRYLITLSKPKTESVKIVNVLADQDKKLHISFDQLEGNTDALKIKLVQNDQVLLEKNLNSLEKDDSNRYVLSLENLQNVSSLSIQVEGILKRPEVYVFESVDEKNTSQTLLSASTTEYNVQTDYQLSQLDKNPYTGSNHLLLLGGTICLIGTGIAWYLYRTSRIKV